MEHLTQNPSHAIKHAWKHKQDSSSLSILTCSWLCALRYIF